MADTKKSHEHRAQKDNNALASVTGGRGGMVEGGEGAIGVGVREPAP